MKVLFDHQIFEKQSFGGISRYFYEIINGLKNHNFAEVEIALKYSNNIYLKNDDFFSTVVKQLNIYKEFWPDLHFKGKGKIFNLFKSANLINSNYTQNKRVSEKKLKSGHFNIFHPTYYGDYFLKYIKNKPFVLTVFDMTYEYFPEYFWDYKEINSLKKNLCQKASKIIAISLNTKKDLINLFGINEKKIKVIYLGSSLNVDDSTIDDGQILNKLPEKYILFVGNRATYKNFTFFITSISSLLKSDKDLNLVCAGGSNFSLEEKELFSQLKISKKLFYFSINDKFLTVLYKNAVAFVFPSLCEGFGIPILESFSCGCPNILANTTSLPEIAKDAAIYFKPKDSNSILEAVSKVIYDNDLRQDLIYKGCERLKDFSWEKAVLETLRVYESVL